MHWIVTIDLSTPGTHCSSLSMVDDAPGELLSRWILATAPLVVVVFSRNSFQSLTSAAEVWGKSSQLGLGMPSVRAMDPRSQIPNLLRAGDHTNHTSVKVAARVRPLLPKEEAEGKTSANAGQWDRGPCTTGGSPIFLLLQGSYLPALYRLPCDSP